MKLHRRLPPPPASHSLLEISSSPPVCRFDSLPPQIWLNSMTDYNAVISYVMVSNLHSLSNISQTQLFGDHPEAFARSHCVGERLHPDTRRVTAVGTLTVDVSQSCVQRIEIIFELQVFRSFIEGSLELITLSVEPMISSASYPTWEDFVSKGTKLQSHLRTTIVLTGAFLDAFQKVADMATGTRGEKDHHRTGCW
ncbi:hypothetical protein GOODEAATRI_010362 [Goodea atripinnis]|uniref:IMD domain-containing protein n=1 Tax=Goodea atripinnis TaxID=208336 RepID=A0ABV0PCZ8_9TELE